jgi:hypothetical protein
MKRVLSECKSSMQIKWYVLHPLKLELTVDRSTDGRALADGQPPTDGRALADGQPLRADAPANSATQDCDEWSCVLPVTARILMRSQCNVPCHQASCTFVKLVFLTR